MPLDESQLKVPFKAFYALIVKFHEPLATAEQTIDDLGWIPTITPAPPAGEWHLHTNLRSLVYRPEGPWDMSTKYTVVLPPTAKSYWGVPIQSKDPKQLDTMTPTNEVDRCGCLGDNFGAQPINCSIVLSFRQEVVPEDVAKVSVFKVTSVGGKPLKKEIVIPAQVLSLKSLNKSLELKGQTDLFAPNKWAVIQPSKPLPYSAKVLLEVGPPIPSAEGTQVDEKKSWSKDILTVPTFEVRSFRPTDKPVSFKDPISILFNQNLVKLENDLVDGKYKLLWTPSITPAPPAGTWSLQRSKAGKFVPNVLVFTPSEPWIRSTEYTVSIPAGSKSSVDESIVEDWTQTFSTPVVELVRVWPAHRSQVGRKPFIFLEFDQPVSDAKVLYSATLNSKLISGNIPLLVVAHGEALTNPTVAKFAEQILHSTSSDSMASPTSGPIEVSPSAPKKSKKHESKSEKVVDKESTKTSEKESKTVEKESTTPRESSKSKRDKHDTKKDKKDKSDGKKPSKEEAVQPKSESVKSLKSTFSTTSVKSSSKSARKWVVLTTAKSLPYHDAITLTLTGLTSAVGTLKSTYSYTLNWEVSGPLESELINPHSHQHEMPSSSVRFSIQFNQPVVSLPTSILPSLHARSPHSYDLGRPYELVQNIEESSQLVESSSQHADSSEPKQKKSPHSNIEFALPVLEMMSSDSKVSSVKADLAIVWQIEHDGKRLVAESPVTLKPSSLYRLSLPGRISSLFGEEIPAGQKYMLRTPCVRVVEAVPRVGGTLQEASCTTPILIRFNQPIDRAAILPHLKFYLKAQKHKVFLSGLFGKSKKDEKKAFCGAVLMDPSNLGIGDGTIKLKLAEYLEESKQLHPVSDDDEKRSKNDEDVKTEKSSVSDNKSAIVDPFGTSHWILIQPEKMLPQSSRVHLHIGPHLTSTLGTCTSERKVKLMFRTAAPLEVNAYQHLSTNGTVVFYFNQNMFFDGAKMLEPKELSWLPLMNIPLPEDCSPTWWVLDSRTLKLWARHWPESTKFVFNMPAGHAVSMLGEKLKEAWTFNFTTSLMYVAETCGFNYETPTDPIFGFKFSQQVDPREIASKAVIVLKGEKSVYTTFEAMKFPDVLASCKSSALYGNSYALLTPETVLAFRNGAAGRVVWMRPVNPLPHGKKYKLILGPGLTSLQGPVPMATPLKYSKVTMEAFRFSDVNFKTTTITRLNPINVYFNRSIADGLSNPEVSDNIQERLKACITLNPPAIIEKVICEYSFMRIYVRSDNLNESKTYKVTIAKWLTDNTGQTLYEDVSDPKANEDARTFEVTINPVSFTCNLVANMGDFPERPSKMFVTYDPMLLHAGTEGSHKPVFRIQNLNFSSIRVCLYKLDPETDMVKWNEMKEDEIDEKNLLTFGTKISDTIVKVPEYSDPNLFGTRVPFDIELTAALENKEELIGQIGLVVLPTKAATLPNSSNTPHLKAWIQCTRMSIEAYPSSDGIHVWVNDMVDGAPLKGVSVSALLQSSYKKDEKQFITDFPSASTSKHGWATLMGKYDGRSRTILATKGSEVCFLRNVSLHRPAAQTKLIASIWNDRGIYRPKETVEIKGYIRQFQVLPDGKPHYTVPLLAEGADAQDDLKNLKWTLLDSQNNKVTDGTFTMSPGFGTFHVTFLLPETINLGNCTVQFTGFGPFGAEENIEARARPSLDVNHTFAVQEFRRPDFVAKSEILEKQDVYLYEENALVKVEASYFAGGSLPDCEVTWNVASTQGAFNPPGWLKYIFTTPKDKLELANYDRVKKAIYNFTKNFKSMTDEKGRNAIKICFKGNPQPSEPVNLIVDIEVLDLNKQSLTSQQKLLVHPSRTYLGVWLGEGDCLTGDMDTPGGPNGKPLSVSIIVADLDGQLIPNVPIKIKIGKMLTNTPNKLQNVLDEKLVASRAGVPAVFEFDRTKFSHHHPSIEKYGLVITTTDPVTSRMSEVVVVLTDSTALTQNSPQTIIASQVVPLSPVRNPRRPPHIHSSLSSFAMTDKSEVIALDKFEAIPIDTLKLDADMKSYTVGSVGKLLVTTSLPLPAEAVVILRGNLGNTIIHTQTLSLLTEVTSVEFTVTEECAPWLEVVVTAVATTVRYGHPEGYTDEAFKRLAHAEGRCEIEVISNHQELTVLVAPEDPNVAPGTETHVNVTIQDWKNNPVPNAEVALVIVDESVLSMTGYELPNPFKTFYDPSAVRGYLPSLAHYSLRKGIQLRDLQVLLAETEEEKKRRLIEEVVDIDPIPTEAAEPDIIVDDTLVLPDPPKPLPELEPVLFGS